MSGSTVIRQRGRLYELRLETPSISFMPEPHRPGEPTHEQEYHASAARRFTDALAPLEGRLDDAIDVARRELPEVELVPLDDKLPLVYDSGPTPKGACRWSAFVGGAPNVGWGHGTLTLAFAKLPDKPTLSRIHEAIARAIFTILVDHHDRERERARRGPVPKDAARFHYTRAADGTIEDLNGEAPGRVPGELPLSPALELCASIAAIIAIAELDGVVHADLDAGDVRVGDNAVSLDGFGETDYDKPAHPPEGRSDFYVGAGPRVDWIARQRYSLGYACYRVIAQKALDAPRAPAAAHDDAIARAVRELELSSITTDAQRAIRTILVELLAWSPARRPSAREAWAVFAAYVEPVHAPPERRGPSKIPERLAADTHGLLVPCRVCTRPALRHAGRNIGTATDYGPDCCWRQRERRIVRAVLVALVLAVAAVLVWWLR